MFSPVHVWCFTEQLLPQYKHRPQRTLPAPRLTIRVKAHKNVALASPPGALLLPSSAAAWACCKQPVLLLCTSSAFITPTIFPATVSSLVPVRSAPPGPDLLPPSRHEENPGLFCLLISAHMLLTNALRLALQRSEEW